MIGGDVYYFIHIFYSNIFEILLSSFALTYADTLQVEEKSGKLGASGQSPRVNKDLSVAPYSLCVSLIGPLASCYS